MNEAVEENTVVSVHEDQICSFDIPLGPEFRRVGQECLCNVFALTGEKKLQPTAAMLTA